MAKKFEPHMIYGDGKSEMADTYKEHMKLKNKGWGHEKPSGLKYGGTSPYKMKGSPLHKAKGLDGKACWKGYKLQGTKMKGGKRVDNCVKM